MNLTSCRARSKRDLWALRFLLQNPRGNPNNNILDHAKSLILSDSHCVFPGLARRFLLLYFALSWRHALLGNFCFRTPARMTIPRRETTFCALVPAAWPIYFFGVRHVNTAQVQFFRIAKTSAKQMKINQTDQFITADMGKIFKISTGLWSKLNRLKSFNLMNCRAPAKSDL